MLMYLVDLALIHHDADTQQEGKHQLVLLKEAAADIAVQVIGQVAVDVGNTFFQVVCRAGRGRQCVGRGEGCEIPRLGPSPVCPTAMGAIWASP